MFSGLVLCAAAACVAMWFGGVQHFVGAPMLGLALGVLLANLLPEKFIVSSRKGIAFSSKNVLRLGIVFTGGTLSLSSITGTGSTALPYILLSIVAAFFTACLVGKYIIKVSTNTRILVAGGTSICGGTAIATLSGVLDAEEDETAYAMTAIFLFDMMATLLWPYVSYLLQFGPEQFSLLAGIAINDVASVTAAGTTYDALMGAAAITTDGVTGGDLAVVVKLTRVVMLIFVALIVMAWKLWREKGIQGNEKVQKNAVSKIAAAFPVFVLGFLALAVVNTVVNFSAIFIFGVSLSVVLKRLSKYFITVALVGVGSKIRLQDIFSKGVKPVLLGGFTWSVVAVITFGYVVIFMK